MSPLIGHNQQQAEPKSPDFCAALARRVLIVEDELFAAMDIELAVLRAGHRVVGFAGTAARAIELAESAQPDIVLMDIRLVGDRDGIDAAIEIRQRFDIPSLIISAYTDATMRQRAMPARPLGIIPKPFDHDLLAVALNGGLKL